jgi:CO/xanthine dehydrogenase FAD-binding subunit
VRVKPALFDYHRPDSIAGAVRLLAEDPGGMILAGGQSLVAAMNFRLAAPSRLIDITRIPGLGAIEVTTEGVGVAAAVRHRQLERHAGAHAVNPLLRAALAHVAHVPIRNRGTTVGSLCHADAAAEMPLVLLLCDGWVEAEGPAGSRRIPAAEFFRMHLTTARAADEVVTRAMFPALPPDSGWAFAEFARRRGDYAIAAVGAILRLDAAGRVAEARLAACGISSRPIRLVEAEAALAGTDAGAAAAAAAGRAAAGRVDAADDTIATAAYRRHLVAALTERVVAEAATRAMKGTA